MLEAKDFGFRHLFFDDVYKPGLGDAFSLKDACDGPPSMNGAKIRRSNSPNADRICTDFGLCCKRAFDADFKDLFEALIENVDVLWEPPPFVPVVSSNTFKPATYTLEQASRILGMPESEIVQHVNPFGYQAYVRIAPSMSQHEQSTTPREIRATVTTQRKSWSVSPSLMRRRAYRASRAGRFD